MESSIFFEPGEEQIMRVHAQHPCCGLRIRDIDDFFPKRFTPLTLADAYAKICATKHDYEMLMEAASFEEVDDYYNPGEEPVDRSFVLEAIVIDKFATTERRMNAFVRAMNKHLKGNSKGIVAHSAIVGTPKKSGQFAYVTVQIPFSDGQVISVVFHAPEGDKQKITKMDTIVAFRWLLNRRDITQIVAPEDGSEVSLDTICVRLSQLIVKNSDRFERTQKEAQAERQELESVRDAVKAAEDRQTELMDAIKDASLEAETLDAMISNTSSQLEHQKTINAQLQAQLDAMRKAENSRVEPPASKTDNNKGSTVDEKKGAEGTGSASGDTGAGQNEKEPGVVATYPKTDTRPNATRVVKEMDQETGETVYFMQWQHADGSWIMGDDERMFDDLEDAKAEAENWTGMRLEPNGKLVGAENKEDGLNAFNIPVSRVTYIENDVTSDDLENALKELAGKELYNAISDITAQVNSAQRSKLNSGKASSKSNANGFSTGEHKATASQIESIWKWAAEAQQGADEKNNQPDLIMRKFVSPVNIKGKDSFVWITVKESKGENRIYSLELMDEKKLREKVSSGAITATTTLARSFEQVITELNKPVSDQISSVGGVSTISPAGGQQPAASLSALDVSNISQPTGEVNPPEQNEQDTPAYVTTLNDILAGKYDVDSKQIDSLLDEAASQAEADGRMEEFEDLFNQAADHLTVVLKKKQGA